MNLNSVNWIMGCLQSSSFAVLINGARSRFFKASRGLRQGCPLSPFLFLIIAEALRKMLKEAKTSGVLKGIRVSESEIVSHLLFVDDIFCSVNGARGDIKALRKILNRYCLATCMSINLEKSCIILNNFSETESNEMRNILPAQRKNIDESFKYLGFHLKPDCYKRGDWEWMIKKVEDRISIWVNRLLSKGED
jgi:hypothetical protein